MRARTVFLSLAVLLSCMAQARGQSDPADGGFAAQVLERTGVPRGVYSVIFRGDPDRVVGLVRESDLFVHAMALDQGVADEARTLASEAGLGIDRVVFEDASIARLSYTDNLMDVVLILEPDEAVLGGLSASEAMRVLRPEGRLIAFVSKDGTSAVSAARLKEWAAAVPGTKRAIDKHRLGAWLELVKPPLDGVDDWSHWEHGPDNNPVSTDAVIRAPYRTQWLGRPYYIAMPAITTAAGGRTFVAMGHIAHHEREEPWLNTVLARNGYNGAELWRKRMPDGYLMHRSAFIATDDAFYMIDPSGEGCLVVDPESGDESGRIRITDVRGEWKWIAMADGKLFALVGEQPDPPETTIVRSLRSHWSWGELSKGYYDPRVPWGFGNALVAYDLEHRKVLWTHREEADIDSRAMVIGGERIYFYSPDARLGCLDMDSGDVVWANDDPELRELIEEPGQGLGSTPGFRSTCFSVYTPKGLFFEAQTRMNVVAVSLEDGSLMWHRGKTTNNPNVIYVDENVLVGIGPGGSTLEVDPLTGETIRDLEFMKRSCARLTATPDSLFCRGWPEGTTRYDRRTGQILFDGSMRPACNDGVIGANGLLYIGPWLCDCNLSLMGTVALCSADDGGVPAPEEARLETMSPPGASVGDFAVSENDWPTYRAGNAHAAASSVAVSRTLSPLWTWRPERDYHPTAPVAAGGLVVTAGSDGVVRALDAQTGMPAWEYATLGPIMQSPTVWEERVYAGSGDGNVYALDAATGRPVWRFRAAPVERRTMVYGYLCSTWPVNSGVTVHDGVAYAAAGIIDYDGTYVYALDARTGEILWQNTSTGHLKPELRKGVSCQGNLTVMGDSLWMAGGNVISPAPYRVASGDYWGPLPFDGSPQANRGEEIGVFGDEFLIFGGRLRYSASENVVNPGTFDLVRPPAKPWRLAQGRIAPAWDSERLALVDGREATLSAYAAEDVLAAARKGGAELRMPAPLWQAGALQSAQVNAIALTADAVLAVTKTLYPGSLEPRWRIAVLDRDNGALVWQHGLPSAACENGLAVDREGRVLVAMADGSVACFGGGAAFSAYIDRLMALGRSGEDRDLAIQRLKQALTMTRDPDDRDNLISCLGELGIDMCRPALEKGFICTWQLLGPVPWNMADYAIDKVLVGEPDVTLDKPCQVAGKTLAWQRHVTVHPTGMIDMAAHFGPHNSHAAYAYAEVVLPEAQNLVLKLGSNDGFKCWFNGVEAGRFDGGRTYHVDENTLRVQGLEGKNAILVKVTQMGGGWGLSVRVADPAGSPISQAD